MALGTWDVDGMLRSMSGRQFLEWLVFAELEPFGPERDDKRIGVLNQTMMNAHRNSKKKPTAYTLADATPLFGDATPTPRRKTWQEMEHIARMLTADNRAQARRKRGS